MDIGHTYYPTVIASPPTVNAPKPTVNAPKPTISIMGGGTIIVGDSMTPEMQSTKLSKSSPRFQSWVGKNQEMPKPFQRFKKHDPTRQPVNAGTNRRTMIDLIQPDTGICLNANNSTAIVPVHEVIAWPPKIIAPPPTIKIVGCSTIPVTPNQPTISIVGSGYQDLEIKP